jgi:hypothetical protein
MTQVFMGAVEGDMQLPVVAKCDLEALPVAIALVTQSFELLSTMSIFLSCKWWMLSRPIIKAARGPIQFSAISLKW